MFLKSEKLFYLNSFNNKDKQHHVRQKGPKINCFLNKKNVFRGSKWENMSAG